MRTYMTIDGIEGESFTLKNVPGAIDVVAFQNNMGYPFDHSLGEKTGPLVYNPLYVTKRVDQATPLIYQHLSTNRAVAEVKILFYRETDSGATKWEHYFTMTLTDVRIIEQTTSLKQQDERSDTASLLEKVGFIARTVDFTHPLASVAHSQEVRDSVEAG
ncbi:MAG: type VI secretion system tube protein Hcp [Planctomycetes bacterium]|nr:type VI secretion system tube protein Hcp [Planctomycetota bacterium]